MFSRATLVFGALCLATAALTGCRGKAAFAPKVALVTTDAGFGDRAYNDEARAGLQACKARTGAAIAEAVPASASAYAQQLGVEATQNYDAVVALGFGMAPDVGKAARRFQAVHFALVDAVVDEPNVESVTFRDQEGAFLAGALAALASRTKHVAFVGGADIGPLHAYEAGFVAGAHAVDPHVRADVRYLLSFADADAARRAAGRIFDGGADVVFAVAGPASAGVIDAAKARPAAFAIGADVDQNASAPGKVLASVVKRIDVAVLRVCSETVAQKPVSGHAVLGIADDGIALNVSAAANARLGAARLARVERIRRAIVAGTLTPPGSRAELARFRPVAIP